MSCKQSGLKEYDIAEYGEFNKPHNRGDNLTGHELLQNAWLLAHGKIKRRGEGLSLKNPAVALYENPMHKTISAMQRGMKLNQKNLSQVSWRRNVLDNIQIMKKAGVPREVILELAKQTKYFAINNRL